MFGSRPSVSRYDASVTDLDLAGYAIADLLLDGLQCEHVVNSLPAVSPGRGGVRELISHPTIVRLLSHPAFGRCLWKVVGRELIAVKATLFDKTAKANWGVQWHQDRVISVKER